MTLPQLSVLRKPISVQPHEIQALLELIPAATLLVDRQNRTIFGGNQPAAAIIGMDGRQLADLALHSLFPTLMLNSLGEPTDLEWPRPSGGYVQLEITPTPLDTRNHWLLLTLVDTESRARQQAQDQRRQQIPGVLLSLGEADLSDLAASLQQALQIAQMTLDIDLLAIYQAEASQPFVQRSFSCGPAEALPDQLSLHDLAALNTPQVWIPGPRRSVTPLQRAARNAGWPFIASVPLGAPNAVVGLLVAADPVQPPSTSLTLALQLLARYVTMLLQSHNQLLHQKSSLQAYQRAMRIHTALQENVQDGVAVLSPDRTLIELNPAAELMLGYASREVVGQPIENILIGSEDIHQALTVAQQIGYLHSLGRQAIYRRDGQSFQAQIRILTLIMDEQLEGWAVFLTDLSEEEQFRVRTQQLEQRALLGEVTAVFAHEVRNPINNISTGLQLMAMNLPPKDPQQELIGRLQQDCDRLAELMKSVLAFARPKEYKLEPLELEPFLRRMLERWHPRLAHARITYDLQVEPGTPAIQGDLRALEQVFTNLITNAAQAMADGVSAAGASPETGGRLTIRARLAPPPIESRQVEISVTDTGPGIPDELRERIFEPFFTTKNGGTGLGLPITKQIITAHRGTIRVISIPGGTSFQVLLPA